MNDRDQLSPDDRSSRIIGKAELFTGLSARLLVLTIAFVMLAEFLIWTPSVAQYRKAYLEERIARAHLAMIPVGSIAAEDIAPKLESELLLQTETYGIVLNLPDQRMLMIGSDMPPAIDREIHMNGMSMVDWVVAAFSTLAHAENRVLRVMGTVPSNPAIGIEIILDEKPMRTAMLEYSQRTLALSMVISLITATLVFLTLQWLMVRPVLRMARVLARFREDPEGATEDPGQSTRTDEIGVALRELGHMQMQVRAALRQKSRLATLGEAVAKINHDLRNTLATAVLAFDRLAEIDDPEVKRLSPRLYKAIFRAVQLCSQTLEYVGASDMTPRRERFHLSELMDEIAAEIRDDQPALNAGDGEAFRVINRVPFEIGLSADRTQLYRALLNLAVNARQAGANELSIEGAVDGDGWAVVTVRDDGPGLLEDIRNRVFEPFATAKDGGTGLGLVIVRDIIAAHRGDIRVAENGPDGVAFEIRLPDATYDTLNEAAS